MKTVKSVFIALVLFSIAVDSAAQTPRRRRGAAPPTAVKPVKVETAQPEPTPALVTPPAASLPATLATVNGQSITLVNLDPRVRQEVEAVGARIAEARRQVLDLQVNTALLQIEANKRGMSPQQLFNLQIAKKITEPTAAEIDKFIKDHRDQINQTDPATMREQVIAYLKGEQETKVTDDFLKRLRSTIPVVNVAPANAVNLPPSAVLVTVGGLPITEGTIAERLKPITYKLRLNGYQLAKQALEVTINDMLLLAESTRTNVPPEQIVRKEISDKVRSPTEAEIAKFYNENKARIPVELAAASNQIASYLQEQDRQRLEQELSTRLRAGADIRILISAPPLPVQSISVDDDPVRGNATAPVTIVEFTDFQCPACAAMQPIIDAALKTYGTRVKLVVRDFPLAMHANARKAAEAANAANAQGKFFEYVDLLFKRQDALDVPSLKKYASELGLNRARFDAALDGGVYGAEIKHDIEDGEMYGIDSTPAIFVNGMAVTEMSAEALRAAIERGLAGTNPAKASTN